MGNQQEKAHIAIAKQVMINRPLLLAENVATVKAVPPDKYAGKYKISMLNIVMKIRLNMRELEKQYVLEGMVDANKIDVYGNVIMGI